MSSTKAAPTVDFRVWCEGCCIRIAPTEDRREVRGKVYHTHCHAKLAATEKRKT